MVIYQNICRGLFEKDKLLFSASICFQILRHAGEIHDVEWNLFLRGTGAFDRAAQPPNPHPAKMTSQAWDLIYVCEQRLVFRRQEDIDAEIAALAAAEAEGRRSRRNSRRTSIAVPLAHRFSALTPMKGLCDAVSNNYSDWKAWADESDPLTHPLPASFSDTVNMFQRLLLVKCFREDKLQYCIAEFVARKLGRKFAESPSSSMEEIYKDLDNKVPIFYFTSLKTHSIYIILFYKQTPCIFVLSSGADPTGMLLRFARKSGFGDRLQIVSLGQGQGPYAKSLIENGSKSG